MKYRTALLQSMVLSMFMEDENPRAQHKFKAPTKLPTLSKDEALRRAEEKRERRRQKRRNQ